MARHRDVAGGSCCGGRRVRELCALCECGGGTLPRGLASTWGSCVGGPVGGVAADFVVATVALRDTASGDRSTTGIRAGYANAGADGAGAARGYPARPTSAASGARHGRLL